MNRGISYEEALGVIVRGFADPVVSNLPIEYASELNKLLGHVCNRRHGMTPTTRIHVVGDLSAQYLLETHHDQQVKLDFIHNHPNTRSNIAILIIAKGTANVTLDATVTVLAEAINTSTQLDIYVVTEPTAKVTAAPT